MMLAELESSVDRRILNRGREYYEEDYVLSLRETAPHLYTAEVEGSEMYVVQIELGSGGAIVYSDCSCPYDLGPVCKHQVAVLYEIRDMLESQKGAPKRPAGAGKQADLKELLSGCKQGELIELLLVLAGDEGVEERIRLHLGRDDIDSTVEQSRKLIRMHIDTQRQRDGYVPYARVPSAVRGAEMVLEKAQRELHKGAVVQAVKLALCIMGELMDLIQECDDSGGDIGSLMEMSLEVIADMVPEDDLDGRDDERKVLFDLLLEAAAERRYDGWSDWRLGILEQCAKLVDGPDRQDSFGELLEKLGKREESEWSRKYWAERTDLMRLEITTRLQGAEQAGAFMVERLEHTGFREIAINQAMGRGDFEEAVRLALDGEQLDTERGHPGTVKRWKEQRYEAYRASGQLEEQRKLAEELLLDREFKYYLELKATYAPEEWRRVYPGLLPKLEHSGRSYHFDPYPRVLIEEGETGKLLEYVSRQPSLVEELYPQLVSQFPEEVYNLFMDYIMDTAERASNRSNYRNVCRIIRMLKKAGGAEAAGHCVRTLQALYPRRTALQDELKNL
ncbi:SWIM zinc finger domain-containing protein [Paenibacillus sp. KR2-11]|uniref:SWIM zinc finger family protein n=1 Tax=Paenibacillus sp. KR2-11 TaxID=3385500 RepID=UPI0038FC6143